MQSPRVHLPKRERVLGRTLVWERDECGNNCFSTRSHDDLMNLRVSGVPAGCRVSWGTMSGGEVGVCKAR